MADVWLGKLPELPVVSLPPKQVATAARRRLRMLLRFLFIQIPAHQHSLGWQGFRGG